MTGTTTEMNTRAAQIMRWMIQRAGLMVLLAGSGLLTSCGRSPLEQGSTPTAPLPPPEPSTSSNQYVGTQSPGYWTLSLDDTQDAFSYAPLTYPTMPPTTGNFALHDGILDFGQVKGKPAGIAIEIPSRAAVLRPGDDTSAPVAMVQQSDCFAVTDKTRFLFTSIPAKQQGPDVQSVYAAYGNIVVNTSADGKSWQFGELAKYEMPTIGGGVPAGTHTGTNPTSFNATCAVTNGQGTITANANPAFSLLPTFKINQAGHFIEDISPAEEPDRPLTSFGFVGVIEPTSAISAADVAVASYRGILYEPTPDRATTTLPISFAPTAGVSASLTGGTYPNGDLTQPASTQYTITLGKQDSVLNGVFPKATLTLADPTSVCPLVAFNDSADLVRAGFDANGNPICMTNGVAIVGNPEGKYVIYFTALDGTLDQYHSYTLQMYLYQK